MKKTSANALRFGLLLSLLSGLSFTTQAQSTTADEPQLRIKITERNGADSRVIERTYRTDGMTDDRRDALVNKLIDSLRAARKGKGNDSNISVIIEDSYKGPARKGRHNRVIEEDVVINGNGRVDGDFMAVPPVPPVAPLPPSDFDMRFRYFDDSDTLPNRNRLREYRLQRRQLDSMTRQLQRQSRDLARDLNRQLAPMTDRLNRDFRNFNWQRDFVQPFQGWADNGGSNASTIRGLNAYPNNPDRQMLNVRFNAPAKGDVQIVVTNTKGKEVARRELKDFTGEFVGQVDIGRKAEGVFFITVTQNEDGAVRRVVLKKEEATK
jgi:hypothetical protein